MSRNNSDTAWKEILDAYLKQCIDYCFPALSKEINWERSWISLEQEFQAITKSATIKKGLLDKLFKVYLQNGEELWILLHIEIQAEYDRDFPKRIFTYGYRIYDKYQRPVVSCAILTDDQLDWCPSFYRVGFAGSFLSSEFLVMKMIDFRPEREVLQVSDNPFACVILAQLVALEGKRKSSQERMQMKFSLTRQLYEKNFTKEQVVNLYSFIDWLIGVPENFEIEYVNQVYQLEESKNMRYVCTAERLGIKKGKAEVTEILIKKMEKMALFLIKHHFDDNTIAKETGLSMAQIIALKETELCQ
jgi:hypothetical protein